MGFLAADPERIERFIALTGIMPGDLPAHVNDRAFLAGVLDHLLSDETLLFQFCDDAGLAPDSPLTARMTLEKEEPRQTS